MTEYYVGDIEEFPEGEARSVNADGIDVAIYHVDGKYYGLSNLYPHRNYELSRTPTIRMTARPPSGRLTGNSASSVRGIISPGASRTARMR